MLIAIDFDGTIVDNLNHKMGERYPPLFLEAREEIKRLRDAGHTIMIFSCNNPRWIKECLDQYQIRVDSIWDKPKPVYDILVDDRVIRFDGNWKEITGELIGSNQT